MAVAVTVIVIFSGDACEVRPVGDGGGGGLLLSDLYFFSFPLAVLRTQTLLVSRRHDAAAA